MKYFRNILPVSPARAALLAATIALLLALAKTGIFFLTGSLVVAVSAWDSAIDFVISLINRKTLMFARLQPDQDHPYGHGKAESIASLGQGAILIGGSLTFIAAALESVHRMVVRPVDPVVASWETVLFFLIAAAASIGVTVWLKYHGRAHNSPALRADAEHYRGDVYANIGSAVGLIVVYLSNIAWLDPLIAIVFALKITQSGFELLKTSVNELMDQDVGSELKLEVEEFVHKQVPEVIDIHRFRGRQSGPHYLFDFHVTLPRTLTFQEVHELVEKIEDGLADKFSADVVVHADPEPEDGVLPDVDALPLSTH